jgi:integrase
MNSRKRAAGRNWKTETERVALTDKRVAALPVPQRRQTIYDTKVDALGLKLEPSGSRVWFWFRAVPQEGQQTGAGKPTWKTIGTHPDTSLDTARAEAQRLNTMLEDWKRSGCRGANPFRSPDTGEVTVHDLYEAYVTKHLVQHSKNPEKIAYDVRLQLKLYLSDWKQRALSTVTRNDVVALHEKLGRTGHHRTANMVVNTMRSAFNWARDANFWTTGENPAARVAKFREEKRDRFLQPDEMVRLLKALDETESTLARDFFTLSLETGARRSNIAAMRWEEVNWALKTWSIPDPKNRFPQTVELSAEALRVLERRFAERKELANPWVFPSRSKSGHIRDPKRAWQAVCRAAKIENANIHDLRRTRGSYMALAGASLLQIGAVLGHRSPASTAVYARLNQQAQRESMALGDRKMKQLMASTERKQLPAPKAKRTQREARLRAATVVEAHNV